MRPIPSWLTEFGRRLVEEARITAARLIECGQWLAEEVRLPSWLYEQLVALLFGVALILPALIHLEAKLTRDALVNSERFASVRGITHTGEAR